MSWKAGFVFFLFSLWDFCGPVVLIQIITLLIVSLLIKFYQEEQSEVPILRLLFN